MNTRILGGNPSREKTIVAIAQPSIFYYKENILQLMYWRRLIPVRKHPPALIYQPLLEGSTYPLLSFTSLTWKGATTPWLKVTTLNTSMDHVSSIFTLDPISSIEHNLQATFHHIFRLDPLHTFKLNHTSKQILINSENPDQIAVTQQNRLEISYFIL